ncbi:hypothetical protein NFI95_12925 [Acetobacteraceae bacterium KSS8]|uniref:Uncharacterized protein n=1 Tax=Endosaccharibacter trunci TaxID=2812733 RepID=A0ABT1WB60_9PROT|nr:hypothetical protein [Acetobacteraceae bacterium KSS8]
MTKGTAEDYWANTAEGYFESMRSVYRPGEKAEASAPQKQARRSLPPLTPSQSILDAIAACAPPKDAGAQKDAAKPRSAEAAPARNDDQAIGPRSRVTAD